MMTGKGLKSQIQKIYRSKTNDFHEFIDVAPDHKMNHVVWNITWSNELGDSGNIAQINDNDTITFGKGINDIQVIKAVLDFVDDQKNPSKSVKITKHEYQALKKLTGNHFDSASNLGMDEDEDEELDRLVSKISKEFDQI